MDTAGTILWSLVLSFGAFAFGLTIVGLSLVVFQKIRQPRIDGNKRNVHDR